MYSVFYEDKHGCDSGDITFWNHEEAVKCAREYYDQDGGFYDPFEVDADGTITCRGNNGRTLDLTVIELP